MEDKLLEVIDLILKYSKYYEHNKKDYNKNIKLLIELKNHILDKETDKYLKKGI